MTKDSQGSVATCFKVWWIFSDHSISESLLSLLVKFENWSIFSKVMGKSRVSCVLTHWVQSLCTCVYCLCNNV